MRATPRRILVTGGWEFYSTYKPFEVNGAVLGLVKGIGGLCVWSHISGFINICKIGAVFYSSNSWVAT